jgi:L-ectoine synthase
MFVKTLSDLKARGLERVLCGGKARSVRFLTKADGLGFTVSDVHLAPGTDQILWYKNHWEANYIVLGDGSVEDTRSGQSWKLEPGVIYSVGPKDRHRVRARTELYIISIFNPPLVGDEAHDADGSYAPSGEVPPGRGTMFVKSVAELRKAGREKVVAGGSARTVRALLQEDGLGFTVCDVNLAAGARNVLWYKHHWEANYILGGTGEVVDLGTNESWKLAPGVMYMVGPKDRHSMRAHTDLHLISIFKPALKGDEMHDAEGTIPPSGPVPPGPAA